MVWGLSWQIRPGVCRPTFEVELYTIAHVEERLLELSYTIRSVCLCGWTSKISVTGFSPLAPGETK
jgi:hypothetical protein